MNYPFQHESGLVVGDDDDLAAVAAPTTVVFCTSDGEMGDIILDGHEFGWSSRDEVEKVAAYFGLDLQTTEREEYVPKNPRRKVKDG